MEHQQQSANISGVSSALLSVLVLSTTGIVIRILTVEYSLSPFILSFWRNCFLVLFLGIYLELFFPYLMHLDKKHLKYMVFFGFVLSLFNLSWNYSVLMNGAGVATVLVCMSAVFTVFLARLFLHEALTFVKIIAACAAFIGAIMVTDVFGDNVTGGGLLGVACGLLSGVCYSCYSLLGRMAGNKGVNPWTTLLYSFGIAALFLFGYIVMGKAMWHSPPSLEILYLGTDFGGWGYLALLAMGPTLLGFGLCNVSLSKMPASHVNLILISEPVFTVILAYYLLGEELRAVQILGAAIIVGAIGLLQLHEARYGQVVTREQL